MFDIDHRFDSAQEFIDNFLGRTLFEPKSLFDVSEKVTSGYLYRGQARKDWSLLPTAHRPGAPLKDYTPQPPDKELLEKGTFNKNQYLALHLHAELRAVQLFLEAADRVGLQTPLDYGALTLHQRIFDDLLANRKIELGVDFPDQRFLPSMALAQHYGVPTRLLDWTESPFVAAYFAAEKASSLTGRDREGSDFAVICLGTELLKKVKSIGSISAPRASNSFLRAQRGSFTLITNANHFFLDNGRWPNIEDAVSAERDPRTFYTRPPLIRFSLPASEADPLLRLLYRMDVSKLSLMPSLNHAASHLAYKRVLWPHG